MNREDIYRLIIAFADGKSGDWEWDDFLSIRKMEPQIDDIREEIFNIQSQNPATEPGWWCSEQGIDKLKCLAERLKRETW